MSWCRVDGKCQSRAASRTRTATGLGPSESVANHQRADAASAVSVAGALASGRQAAQPLTLCLSLLGPTWLSVLALPVTLALRLRLRPRPAGSWQVDFASQSRRQRNTCDRQTEHSSCRVKTAACEPPATLALPSRTHLPSPCPRARHNPCTRLFLATQTTFDRRPSSQRVWFCARSAIGVVSQRLL